jgi:hypothetical protein
MKMMRLVFVIFVCIFTFAVYSSQVIAQNNAATKKMDRRGKFYDALAVFFRESRTIDKKKLNKIVNSVVTKPEEVKAAIEEIDLMQQDLESDVNTLRNYVDKLKAGNFVLIFDRRWPATTKIQGKLVTKDEYGDILQDVTSNRRGVEYLEVIDASTEFIKRNADNLIREIESLLEDVKKWKAYYLGQLTKPPKSTTEEPGATGGTLTEPSSTENIGGQSLVFIVQVANAEKTDQLIEGATVELILCKPKEKHQGVSRKTSPSEASSGSEKIRLSSLFDNKTFAIVETSSGQAKFTIPADTLANICSVKAYHPEYEDGLSSVPQNLLALSNEPRRFIIYLKPKAVKPLNQDLGLQWRLYKTTEDPDKKSGVAVGGYNICDSVTKSSVTIHNEKSEKTKISVQASGDIPPILKPNQKFKITMSVSCTTEDEYCCIDAGVATQGIECKPTERVGGCQKAVNDSKEYECGVTSNSLYYDTLIVAPFAGGLGQMARYEYVREYLTEQQPQASSWPKDNAR